MKQFDAETEPENGSEIDLLEIVQRLWKRRNFIIGCMAAGLLFGLYMLQTSNYVYSITLKVIPAQTNTTTGSGSGRGGSLGALMAIATGGSSQQLTPFTLYLDAVFSRAVANDLAKDPHIMHYLYSSQWNEKTQQWQKPHNWKKPIIDSIRELLGVPVYQWQPPSGADLQSYIQGAVTVTTDPASPVTTIEMDNPDPKFAVNFLSVLNHTVDSRMRKRALERSTANIQYLSQELNRTTIAEHRLALTEALSEQEQFRMMASSNVPYAADVFDGPLASMHTVAPRPLFLLLSGIFAGLVIGMPLALLFPNWDWIRCGRTLRKRSHDWYQQLRLRVNDRRRHTS